MCIVLQVKSLLDEILEKLSDEFNMMELFAKAEEKTPFVLVALQECERMNTLTGEMKRSLKEVDLGLKVSRLVAYQIDSLVPPTQLKSMSNLLSVC